MRTSAVASTTEPNGPSFSPTGMWPGTAAPVTMAMSLGARLRSRAAASTSGSDEISRATSQSTHFLPRGRPVRRISMFMSLSMLSAAISISDFLGEADALGPVARREGILHRVDCGAFGNGHRAARAKATARRRVGRIGQVAFQDDALALGLEVGIGHGHRGQQRLGVGMGWC